MTFIFFKSPRGALGKGPPWIKISKQYIIMIVHKTIIFNNHNIDAIVDTHMNIWFNAKEIAESLDYSRPKKVIMENIQLFEKKQLKQLTKNTYGRQPHSIYINESGLYSLILKSRKPSAKKFKKWITSEVIPSLRQNGYYEMKQKNKSILSELNKKINALKKSNETLQCDLKKEKYPNGAVVYAIEYVGNDTKQYRIGMSTDFNKRKKQYNTHLPNNAKVVILKKTNHACKFEYCLKSQLYDFRIKNRKDFYKCSLKQLKKAFTNCELSISSNTVQKGGERILEDLQHKTTQYRDSIKKLRVNFNKFNLLEAS